MHRKTDRHCRSACPTSPRPYSPTCVRAASSAEDTDVDFFRDESTLPALELPTLPRAPPPSRISPPRAPSKIPVALPLPLLLLPLPPSSPPPPWPPLPPPFFVEARILNVDLVGYLSPGGRGEQFFRRRQERERGLERVRDTRIIKQRRRRWSRRGRSTKNNCIGQGSVRGALPHRTHGAPVPRVVFCVERSVSNVKIRKSTTVGSPL